MCGIAGWIDYHLDLKGTRELLVNMTETLSSRGPDASGYHFETHGAFGHRRLIVVDPVGGAQPMTRSVRAQTYTMVYNGELYNTEDLRTELLVRGYAFRGHSDTEVLLTAYIEWGPACTERLNGIYAFAVWEQQGGQLFLARDRMGVKPLFYWRKGSALLFASEIKALLTHPEIEPELDAQGLAEVFGLGPGRTPGVGVFRGIHELKPGHWAQFSRDGLKTQAYWRLRSLPHRDSAEDTADNVRTLFMDTVRRQMISDVPVCSLLSGGLDSSLISVLASQVSQEKGLGPLKTFSVDYRDNDQYFVPSAFQPEADGPWIHKVSAEIGSVHTWVELDTPHLADALLEAMLARDLPGMADVDASLLLFCREIKKHATVALSGECADEVFGGYPWFYRHDLLQGDTFPWSGNLKLRGQLIHPDLRRSVQAEDYVRSRYEQTIAEVPRLDGEAPEAARRREMFYLNMQWFMATLLDRKDRMSMAAGLEVRVPFCDHRLVEYVWNIPWELKRLGGREKGILREAMSGILPQGVLWRKKTPYPKTHHPAYYHAVKNRLAAVMNTPEAPLLQIVDRAEVNRLMEDGVDLALPWYGQLMTLPQVFAYLLQMNAWLRRYNIRIRG